MIRALFPALIIFALLWGIRAQAQISLPEASKESRAYGAFRAKITRPPYGITKVTALIAKHTLNEDGMVALDDRTLSGLSLREQFTYHMIHGEADEQICDAMPVILNEHLKIFGYLPVFFGETGWSPRQQAFFTDHKDSVLAFIKESTLRSGHMGANYKQAIADMKAVEMIPFITAQIRREPKDHDLLTVLLLLMKDGAYQPFMTSPTYKKLYGDSSDYRAALVYNKANETLIIDRAMAFYTAQKP